MSTILSKIGGASAAHPWRTLAAWLLVLAAALGLNATFGGTPHDNYTIPGLPFQAGQDFVAAHFPDAAGTDARVVVHDPAGRALNPDTLALVRTRLSGIEHVGAVSAPRLSADADTALFTVSYRVPVTDLTKATGTDALDAAVAPARDAGLTVALGGQVPENFTAPSGTAEAVGIVAALIILVLTLGTVVAAGLPLAVALFGLGIGTSVIGLLAAVTDISTTAPTIATMVGLGVGIDYALLLVSRQVEGLRRGLTPRAAAAEATGTAGESVVVAGLTVLVALFGLRLAGLPVYSSIGYATLAVVGAAMLASVTLVPALCALAGNRLVRRRAMSVAAPAATRTARWAAWIGARPVPAALVAVALLAALALPALGMRTWPQDAGSQPTSNTTRQAYDLTAAEFGPGANGPLLVAASLPELGEPLDALVARLSAVPGVAHASPVAVSADAALVAVEPTTGPQDVRTAALLADLRGLYPADQVRVTGLVAVYADISDRLADRLWWVIAFVVAVSLALLTVLLRAPIVALKAALMNIVSVAAAYGVLTAVFQTDLGARAVGLPHAVPVSSWVPILMFTVLFGLSMDYEVFLLSRVREDWLATGDPRGSVVRGLAGTGRVITSAAAIMVAVFTGFAFDPDVTVKMTGVGMGVAVLIDATIVRMVLVPATMALLGRYSWWAPRWLAPHAATAPATDDPLPDDAPAMAGR